MSAYATPGGTCLKPLCICRWCQLALRLPGVTLARKQKRLVCTLLSIEGSSKRSTPRKQRTRQRSHRRRAPVHGARLSRLSLGMALTRKPPRRVWTLRSAPPGGLSNFGRAGEVLIAMFDTRPLQRWASGGVGAGSYDYWSLAARLNQLYACRHGYDFRYFLEVRKMPACARSPFVHCPGLAAALQHGPSRASSTSTVISLAARAGPRSSSHAPIAGARQWRSSTAGKRAG